MRTPDDLPTFKDNLWVQVFVQEIPKRDPSLVEQTAANDFVAAAKRADTMVALVEKQLDKDAAATAKQLLEDA
jgi:hypothetical protein